MEARLRNRNETFQAIDAIFGKSVETYFRMHFRRIAYFDFWKYPSFGYRQ